MKGCFEELLFVHVFLNTRLLLHTDNPFHMAALLLRFLPAHKQPSTCMHFTFPVLVHSKPKPQNVNKKKALFANTNFQLSNPSCSKFHLLSKMCVLAPPKMLQIIAPSSRSWMKEKTPKNRFLNTRNITPIAMRKSKQKSRSSASCMECCFSPFVQNAQQNSAERAKHELKTENVSMDSSNPLTRFA
jgi:hypothetical protein